MSKKAFTTKDAKLTKISLYFPPRRVAGEEREGDPVSHTEARKAP
jgi:hypothetical protein